MFEVTVASDLKLRQVTEDFATQAFAVVQENREQLSEWLPWVAQTTEVRHEANYLRHSFERFKQGLALEMAIFHLAEDQAGDGTSKNNLWRFIGMCGIVNINRKQDCAEIGYWLDKRHQGKGIVTKCCRRLIEFSFTELNVGKMKIMAHEDNQTSISVAKRLGFVLTNEKLTEPNPKFHGDVSKVLIFAKTREDWERTQAHEEKK